MASSYRRALERWLGELDVKAETVIDIGGAQLPVRGRTRSWQVEDYQIWDLAEPHAGAPSPDVVFNVEEDTASPPSQADVVFCLEVMDYLIDPLKALQNIRTILLPGGLAYVSFPFVYPHHQPVEHEGLRYSAPAIYRLGEAAGLEVAELHPRLADTDLLSQFYRAEGMRMAKGYQHNVTGFIAVLERV